MNDFRSFNQLRTNELAIVRNGFIRPWYDFTDGQFSYGKISYTSFWKTTTVLEAAEKSWTIKKKNILSRSLIITDDDGMEAGTIKQELLSRKIRLSMNNGFEAVYLNKKIFNRTFSLTSDQYGDLLDIKTALWGFKKPFTVSVDLDKLKAIPDLPLLALLGVNLILIKQAQAAASAGVGR